MKTVKEGIFTERTGVIVALVTAVMFIISIIVFLVFGNWHFSSRLDEAKVGQFGDFVGGVAGSLIALVAVILYYVALREQQKDIRTNQIALKLQIRALEQQITEFEAQRHELEATRKIYEQQTKTMKNQQFDSNFYSLLNVFIAIKSNLNKNGELNYFENVIAEIAASLKYEQSETIIDFHFKVIEQYLNCYLKERANLSLYFITLYRLLKMIDDCEHFTENEKLFYAKVLRSQVTKDELLILYYNYHSSFGVKVRHLVLKYDFFKHLETLTKIEFEKKFTISEKNQVEIVYLTDSLGNLLERNLRLATDIENSEAIKVEERDRKTGIILGIYIDEALEVKVYLDKKNTEILSLSPDQFSELIYYYLYDELFLNKFIIPANGVIEKSVTTSDDQVVFNYRTELL